MGGHRVRGFYARPVPELLCAVADESLVGLRTCRRWSYSAFYKCVVVAHRSLGENALASQRPRLPSFRHQAGLEAAFLPLASSGARHLSVPSFPLRLRLLTRLLSLSMSRTTRESSSATFDIHAVQYVAPAFPNHPQNKCETQDKNQ